MDKIKENYLLEYCIKYSYLDNFDLQKVASIEEIWQLIEYLNSSTGKKTFNSLNAESLTNKRIITEQPSSDEIIAKLFRRKEFFKTLSNIQIDYFLQWLESYINFMMESKSIKENIRFIKIYLKYFIQNKNLNEEHLIKIFNIFTQNEHFYGRASYQGSFLIPINLDNIPKDSENRKAISKIKNYSELFKSRVPIKKYFIPLFEIFLSIKNCPDDILYYNLESNYKTPVYVITDKMENVSHLNEKEILHLYTKIVNHPKINLNIYSLDELESLFELIRPQLLKIKVATNCKNDDKAKILTNLFTHNNKNFNDLTLVPDLINLIQRKILDATFLHSLIFQFIKNNQSGTGLIQKDKYLIQYVSFLYQNNYSEHDFEKYIFYIFNNQVKDPFLLIKVALINYKEIYKSKTQHHLSHKLIHTCLFLNPNLTKIATMQKNYHISADALFKDL